jgi:hypothetical protein
MDLPLDRVKSGESTILRVQDITERETDFGTTYDIEGDLAYGDHFVHPNRILDSCKVHGGDGDSSGSWMVTTPLEPNDNGSFDQAGVNRPEQIRNSARATVEEMNRSTGKIQIEVDGSPFPPYITESFRFVEWHRGLTDPTSYTEKSYQWQWEPFQQGDLLILDPYADSWPHERAYDALEHAGSNYLYDLLRRTYSSGESEQFDVGFADPGVIDDFLNAYESTFDLAPKGKQREFISQAEQAISVLQGPPGTGKTSYTLAPAILSRLYAYTQSDDALVGGVTAPSHTAVNEALDSLRARLKEFQIDSTIALGDIELYRIGGSGGNLPDGVAHIDYYDADDRDRVRAALRRANTGSTHVLLFATPTSMRGIVDKLVGSGTIPATGATSAEDAEEFIAAGGSLYDLLVVDEASMLDLPNTLLAGAFLAEDGQALFIGDHRQMEPVQTHEWETEDRRTIEENIPFMSALNFLRFLRGDLSELEFVERQSPEIGDAIPMIGLDCTYRMHKVLADILTKLVYKDDDITLESDRTETLGEVSPSTPGVTRAMNPDVPVVLVIHDEAASQDANLTEVAIVEALTNAIDDTSTEDIGVVTPHNAQKGRLRERLGDQATPNTVEKFQGGERDAIFVSATASDPDYVRAESDFLLNPNRLNVAMSRMKKKLVIIASESVFQVIPTDADKYNKSIIWKRLYGEMGVLDEFDSAGRYALDEFLPSGIRRPSTVETTSLTVYTLGTTNND